MSTHGNFDYLIIGSGAGGCAAAYALTETGANVLLLEKGQALPKDGSTLDVEQVIRQGRFKSRELWLNTDGVQFTPEEYFNLGGKTKWYGAALLRFAPHEFQADPAHQCLGWPIRYDDLAPYYEQTEDRLGVRVFEPEPGLSKINDRLSRQGGWRAEALPLALAPNIVDHPQEASHFDAFASVKGLKHDAERAFLDTARAHSNLRVVTGATVAKLVSHTQDPQRIAGVTTQSGQQFTADNVLLAAGALHSPRLLQDYLRDTGLDARLPCANSVGRYYKQHLLTAVVAFSWRRQTDLLRKTLLFLNDRFAHSSVQPLGFDGELIGALMPSFVPRTLATALGQYAYGFFLQTEDGSNKANQVIAGGHAKLPQLDYNAQRIAPALSEHQHFVRDFRRTLLRAGFAGFAKRIPLAGTAHACGSLVAGNDPSSSVVNADGRVHGLKNLFVVDGSVLPRSSRVNPSLTIFAWSQRVCQILIQHKKETRHDCNQQATVA